MRSTSFSSKTNNSIQLIKFLLNVCNLCNMRIRRTNAILAAAKRLDSALLCTVYFLLSPCFTCNGMCCSCCCCYCYSCYSHPLYYLSPFVSYLKIFSVSIRLYLCLVRRMQFSLCTRNSFFISAPPSVDLSSLFRDGSCPETFCEEPSRPREIHVHLTSSRIVRNRPSVRSR